MKINDKIKNFIRSWLNVNESNVNNVMMIQTDDDLRVEQLMAEIWYQGKPSLLEQFYKQYQDGAGNSMFWKAQSSTGMPIRKIHTGLPSLIVEKIAQIVVDDMSDINFYKGKGEDDNPLTDEETTDRWTKIAEEHDFKASIVKEAVKEALGGGEATFKLSYDALISEYPIIEIFNGRQTDLNYKRSRFVGADFITHKLINKKNHFLKESYAKDGVTYSLFNEDGEDVSISTIEELEDLYPIEYNTDMILAIPLIIKPNKRFKGRGQSILAGKEGSFDSFDEVWSQWMDAIRAGRTVRYIPESLIPRNQNSGYLMTPSAFDNQYISVKPNIKEDAKDEIKVESPDIQSEKYLAAYVTALDQCLQGLISPSTLGIDVKKLDNAEAQREKEKTTLYTYQEVIEVLEKVIPRLVKTVLKFDDMLKNQPDREYDISVEFGGYANPSFEAQVETVGKAKTSGVMSIERTVEMLYGDKLTKDEKSQEVERLKAEQGYSTEEPAVNEYDA